MRYPIPHTEKIEAAFSPVYMYFPLEDYMNKDNSIGLDDEGLYGEYKHLARVYYRNGIKHQVVKYDENSCFEVVTENSKAMMFVDSFYPDLVEGGYLKNKCPTVMLKHLLESGVVRIAKGSIDRLNRDAKRAQALFSLRTTTGIPVDEAVLRLSVPKKIKDRVVELTNNTSQTELDFIL